MPRSLLKGNRQQYLIVGCGRLGSVLANQLSTNGHHVIIVDRRKKAFEKLSPEFSGFEVLGSAVELDVLRQAKIDQADIVFAVTTEDNTNLMVAQIAQRIFHIKNVVARVFDPKREAYYQELGIKTISPTQLSSQAFLGIAGLESHN